VPVTPVITPVPTIEPKVDPLVNYTPPSIQDNTMAIPASQNFDLLKTKESSTVDPLSTIPENQISDNHPSESIPDWLKVPASTAADTVTNENPIESKTPDSGEKNENT